jgi:hypothetical protein
VTKTSKSFVTRLSGRLNSAFPVLFRPPVTEWHDPALNASTDVCPLSRVVTRVPHIFLGQTPATPKMTNNHLSSSRFATSVKTESHQQSGRETRPPLRNPSSLAAREIKKPLLCWQTTAIIHQFAERSRQRIPVFPHFPQFPKKNSLLKMSRAVLLFTRA